MTPTNMIAAILVATCLTLGLHNPHKHQVLAVFNSSNNQLECLEEPITRLPDDCHSFKVYNQRQWARMSEEESDRLARRCACRMVNLDWESAFDDHPSTRRTHQMVMSVMGMPEYRDTYPPMLWSDIDVLVKRYSIYISTNDYFSKRRRLGPSWSWLKESDFEREAHLRDLRYVCFKVAVDKQHYYQYLENLQRINSVMFFRLLEMNDAVNLIYQASKSCKLLLIGRPLEEFELKPKQAGFYAVDKTQLKPSDVEAFNEVQSAASNIDLALRDASVWLANCKHWQDYRRTPEELQAECPMMLGDNLPSLWIQNHTDPRDRSQVALRCGCQLLLHNSTWIEMMQDKNINIMSRTLTQYLNQHPMPSLNQRDSSTWQLYGWFNEIMAKFAESKKVAVKAVVKFMRGDPDPTDQINNKTNDEEQALELLRLGCNRILFNHIKGSKKQDDIKLVKYLDNLRFISQDPLFVFHLTLQDASLFKLYALSKLCEPVVR